MLWNSDQVQWFCESFLPRFAYDKLEEIFWPDIRFCRANMPDQSFIQSACRTIHQNLFLCCASVGLAASYGTYKAITWLKDGGNPRLHDYLVTFNGKTPLEDQFEELEIELERGHKFLDPISFCVINQPVKVIENGHTFYFDYESILGCLITNSPNKHLKDCECDNPITRAKIRLKDLQPAPELVAQMQDMLDVKRSSVELESQKNSSVHLNMDAISH